MNGLVELESIKKMGQRDDVHQTKGDLCRFQLTMRSLEQGFRFMSTSRCIIEELSVRCNIRDEQALRYMKKFRAGCVELPEEGDRLCKSERFDGSWGHLRGAQRLMSTRRSCVMYDSASGVRLDPELLRSSRKVEIDFMNRLEVYRKRPRNWAKDKGIHVSPTKCVDVNEGDAERPEYRSRLGGKELKRWEGTSASMGPFECVMFILSKTLSGGEGGGAVHGRAE